MANELAIATHGLTKQFDRLVAVNDVDLEIGRGEVYGLIGPNGAGKTTLIRLLALAEEPTIGDIYINDEQLSWERSNQRIKQYLGYLPDDFPMYDDLTVWDYLDYFARLYQLPRSYRRQRLLQVLELVQLVGKRDSYVGGLSRGMKQRLSLARTIIHEPILLLLDEPVSGLDPIARMQFREVIKALQDAGMTILISSHVLSDLAELCTSIGIMEMGYLVESAPLATLYQRLSHQSIVISVLEQMDALQSELKNCPYIGAIEVQGNRVKASFSGTPDDAATLLRSLVLAHIPITEFKPTQDDLETIFLKLGHQQVS